jgi:hypothetical protein
VRTLPAALTAAQRARSRKPYLNVTISNRFPSDVTPIWTNLYDGAEADGPHAAAATTNGYLTRVRISANGLYRNRANPASSPDWSTWTNWRAATRLCAIARYGNNLAAFAVDNATPTLIYLSESADGGANWGAFALAITHSSTVAYIAAARKSNGDLCVIVNDGNNIAAYRRLSTVWQAKVVSTTNLSISGLAMYYEADWNCIVTGQFAWANSVVGRQLFGDGYSQAVGTWSTLLPIVSSIITAYVGYSAPFIDYPNIVRLTFRESYGGVVAYDRIMMTSIPATQDFVNINVWREPIPLAEGHTYGLAICSQPSSPYPFYLCSPRHVDTAPASASSLDVTADVLSADVHETDVLHPSISTIVLDNSSGRYNTLGSGANLAIRKGAQVRASPGYNALKSDGPTFWIVGLHHTYPRKGGVATLTILAADAWSFLARWTAPTTYTFLATKNCFQLAWFLLSRLGFEFSSFGSSPALVNIYPTFVVTAGTTGLAAIRNLFRHVPDVLITRSAFVYAYYPQASDASEASYAYDHNPTTQHEITAIDYHDDLKDANHQRVIAGLLANILGEALDLDDIRLFYASAHQVADPNITTGADATDRAIAEQRRVDIPANADHLVAPVHCGVEVFDTIAITDPRLGLVAAKRRVLAIHLIYRRTTQPVYEHVLTLGAV